MLQHFDFLLVNAACFKVGRRLHRNKGQNLQQMVLQHIATLPRLVKIIPTAFDANLFRHRDLDMVNGAMVPIGGENSIGKTQGQ